MDNFLSYTIFGFAICSLLLGIVYYKNNPNKQMSYTFLAFCISSSIWSLGFGLLIAQTNTNLAWLCRSIGMLGVFPYVIFGMHILMDLAGTNGLLRKVSHFISLSGIMIYPFIIQPKRQIFRLTKFGMSYSFVSDTWTTIYNIYNVVMFFLFLLVIIKMLRNSKLHRQKVLTIRLLLFLIVFCFGTILDSIMPLLGFYAFPGSTITQSFAVFIVYGTLIYEVKNSASSENVANYIYHFINFPILVFNYKKELVLMSDSAYTFFKIPKEEWKIQKIEDIFSSYKPILNNKKESWKEEYFCKLNQAYCQLSIEKLIDKYKDIIGYVVVVYDLTEKNKIIEELDVARIEAENATKAKDNFLANMSHEIRTPLNVVLGMNEMISKEKNLDLIYKYSKDIGEAGNSLLTTINDILDFSKIQSGKLNIIEANYYVAPMLKSTINLLKDKAKEKNLALIVQIDPQLPLEVCGDEMRIKQILINIINNAIKYTKKGQITIMAKKEEISEGHINLIMSVKDTGIGIKEEDLKNLFVSFKRLEEKRNRMIEGTGLGLSIVQRLINLMKGKIEVESQFGIGSTFTVTIPQKVINKTPIGSFSLEEELSNVKKETTEVLTTPGAKILAVDDNFTNLIIVKGLLKKTGAKIDVVKSGIECLEKIKIEKYDLIFLDHMMPELDGIETLHLMKKQKENMNRDTPVIALTANAIEGAKEEYLNNGFTDYLSKPVSGKDLEGKLRTYLPKEKIKIVQEES